MRKVFGTGFAAAFACLVFMAAPEAVASTSVKPGGSDNAQLPISTFEIAQLKAARIQAGPHGGGTSSFVGSANPNEELVDDGYNGTLASMTCSTIDASSIPAGATVTSVEIDIAISHTWVGDLTIKLVGPGGGTLGVLSRPGLTELTDDGTGCCGDNSNLSSAFPITFADGLPDDAETMGSTLPTGDVICDQDDRCDYFPNPDSVATPPSSFAGFAGGTASGGWQLCIGDASAGDLGTFVSWNIEIGYTGGVTAPRANTYAIWNNAPGDTASIATFDVTTPGTLNVIGSTGIPSAQFINGLEFEPTSGKLYLTTDSATNYFFDVDIATGLASNGRGSGLSAGDTIGDLSYDHFQSRMLAVGNAGTAGAGARLYEIDLMTGDAALLGPVGNLTEGFATSLAVRPSDGLIFLHGIETDRWYTVDPDTLQATALGPLGVNTNFGQGASFDPQSLILYHAMLTMDGGNQNRLAVIDQTNGLPAFIGTLGAGLTQIGDIAFPPSRVFSDGFEE